MGPVLDTEPVDIKTWETKGLAALKIIRDNWQAVKTITQSCRYNVKTITQSCRYNVKTITQSCWYNVKTITQSCWYNVKTITQSC